MIDLPTFKTHPTSLWDYLEDMASYMPSKGDRERLQKAAQSRGQEHRVRIWDYFFRPRPEDVGKSVRSELSERWAEAASREAEGTQLLQQSLEALARLEQIWRNERDAVEAQLLSIQTDTAARETAQGRKTVLTGTTLAGGSLLAGALLYLATAGARGADACAPGCLFTLWFFVGIPAIIVGATMIHKGNRRLSANTIQALVASQQKSVRDSWAQRSPSLEADMDAERRRVAFAKEILDRLVPHLRSRIADLERLLRNLLDQLPPVPSVDEVETWLTADLKELRADGTEQLGIEGQTINLLNAENPFLISGPAEIQGTDFIPPTYGGADLDRKKYLHARRFGNASDGRPVRHYGVFYLELLFIAEAVLARYSVFFDFIRGERIRESAPQQHFADVVTMEMRKEYRQILIGNESVALEREPSMILTMNSGDVVAVTLPSKEYFDAVGAGKAANFDATKAAESALRAITHRVKEAKKNLEVGQIARMKEAERED
jgi:hypothetical protein